MESLRLAKGEIAQVISLVEEALTECPDLESPAFLRQSAVLAQDLPLRLRRHLARFRLDEPTAGALLISGFLVLDDRIGPTPSSFDEARRSTRTLQEDTLLLMISSLLGDVIGWATQQSGHLVHEVFPIRAHADMQIGTGCRQLLWWHTEDAFHPLRADYLALFCLRNPQATPTTLASLERVQLDDETVSQLFAAHYTIRPDESHLGHTGPIPPGIMPQDSGTPWVASRALEKVAVFFGERRRPYLRLDPYFMDRPVDSNAARALQNLIDQLDANLTDVVLEPGDLLLVDNFRAVHGRRPFQARFDGTDRWLKRTLIARDLRKSLAARGSLKSRIIR